MTKETLDKAYTVKFTAVATEIHEVVTASSEEAAYEKALGLNGEISYGKWNLASVRETEW